MSQHRFGIQRRIFVSFGLFILLVSAIGGWGINRYFTTVYRTTIEQHQFREVTLLAKAMDEQCAFYLKNLQSVTRQLPTHNTRDSRSAKAWLQSRWLLMEMFPNGIALFRPDGQLLAETTLDFMGDGSTRQLQTFLAGVSRTGQAGLSRAYGSPLSREAAIMLAAPCRGEDGKVFAILAGSVDLLHDDFLGAISNYAYPSANLLYLVGPNRELLIQPVRGKAFTAIGQLGPRELVDQALEGWDAGGERAIFVGARAVSSLRRLQSLEAILVVSMPLAEAFSPIYQFRLFLTLGVTLVVLSSLLLAWLISHRLSGNLAAVAAQIESFGHLPAGNRTIQFHDNDEVGLLASSFNDMIERLDANELELLAVKAQTDEELAITKHILQRLVDPGLRALPPTFHMETQQTQRINGDACTYRQGLPGIHFGFLCDATGHGLAAGVSTIPAVQAFLSMTTRDIPLETIYREINAKIRQMMPTGRFVCLILLRLDLHNSSLTVLNAGLPDAVLLPSSGKPRQIQSRNLPAGVVDVLEQPVVEQMAVVPGDRIFACTDGLQELFGEQIHALLLHQSAQVPFLECRKALQEALVQGETDQEQLDDVSWSLWEVPALEGLQIPEVPVAAPANDFQTTFSVDLTLDPHRHPVREILPDCLRLLNSQGLPEAAGQLLAMALTEALTNAVDHGLLGLDSLLKEDGFEAYDATRRTRLAALTDGSVSLRIALRSDSQSLLREILIEVEDSGPGFDWRAWQNGLDQDRPVASGRGLLILRSIASDFGFNEAGNSIHFTLPAG